MREDVALTSSVYPAIFGGMKLKSISGNDCPGTSFSIN